MTTFPEWLLWAKKLKDEHSRLKERISALETAREKVQIAQKVAPTSSKEAVQPLKRATARSKTRYSASKDARSNSPTVELASVSTQEGQVSREASTSESATKEPASKKRTSLVQGNLTLCEYLERASGAFRAEEEAFIQSFLNGLRNQHQRSMFTSALQKTERPRKWQDLHSSVSGYLSDIERRRRKRRRIDL